MKEADLFMGNNSSCKSDFIITKFNDETIRDEQSYMFNLGYLKKNLIKSILSTEGNLASIDDIELLTTGRFNNLSFSNTLSEKDIQDVWAVDKCIKFMGENFHKPVNRELIEYYNSVVVTGVKSKYSGRVRTSNVFIRGAMYTPPDFTMLDRLFDNMMDEVSQVDGEINKAVSLVLGISKLQLFIDGNKRTAQIVALHHLCNTGQPLLILQDKFTQQYLKYMKEFYESGNNKNISDLIYSQLDINHGK